MITITLRPNAIHSYQLPDIPDYTSVNWRVSASPHIWRPPTDLFEVEDSYVVRIEIAGMSEDDFEIVLAQREKIVQQLRSIGYTFVALDLVGYRMGSLNQLLKVTNE